MLGLSHCSETVAGRYRLEREIGRGGNGLVWQALDLRLGHRVAIKRLHPHGDSQQAARDRFLREARLAAAVSHENVVRVLDFGTDRGDPYLVMELVSGVSLYEWLQVHGLMDPEAAIELSAQVLDGLQAIHDQGMVHRDLKPENVMVAVSPEGVVPKLLDFGVAAVVDPTTGRRSAMTTRRGFAFGTPHYMAPEQARGSSDLDARCDVYGAGVLLYEMMTGRVPFEAEHPGDLLIAIIEGQPAPLSAHRRDLPPALVRVVEKATARARWKRYASARAMASALRRVDRRVEPRRRRRPWSLWASAAAALLGTMAIDLASAPFEPARAERPTPPGIELKVGPPQLVHPPAGRRTPAREGAVTTPREAEPAAPPSPSRETGEAPLAFRILDY